MVPRSEGAYFPQKHTSIKVIVLPICSGIFINPAVAHWSDTDLHQVTFDCTHLHSARLPGQSGWRAVMAAGGSACARVPARRSAHRRPVPAGHVPDQVRRVGCEHRDGGDGQRAYRGSGQANPGFPRRVRYLARYLPSRLMPVSAPAWQGAASAGTRLAGLRGPGTVIPV